MRDKDEDTDEIKDEDDKKGTDEAKDKGKDDTRDEGKEEGKGPSIKYVTLQGGGSLRKCDSLWQGEGVKIMWRHTFNFFTIHNFMFYFIFYHT